MTYSTLIAFKRRAALGPGLAAEAPEDSHQRNGGRDHADDANDKWQVGWY